MSQTSTINGTASRSRRNPLDALIDAIANRIGGKKAKEVERFLRFAIVGTIGAIIDSGTLFLMQATILPPTLQNPDWNVALAQTISFSLATLSNYIWNRYWTYPDSRSRSWRQQMIQFAIISIIGWVFRTIWITSIHDILGHALMPIALPFIQMIHHGYLPTANGEAKLGTMAAWFVGVIVVMIWNFAANRLWTYNDVE
ncbi:MAG TPA: GtrA family protein [Phototrophicaceae bacterium]|nr:GtrA family protein [Phototrophicaceae bacterium]